MNFYETKILEFISKAQQKIGELGNQIITSRLAGDPYENDQYLREDLIAAVRTLNLDESDLNIHEKIAMCEILTGQGRLDIIPFRLIDHLVYQGSGISGGGGGSIAHDDTTGLKGGFTGQRYHLSLDEKTRILAKLNEVPPLPITSDSVLTGGIIFSNPDDSLNWYVDAEDGTGTTWRIGSTVYGPVMRQDFNFPVADLTLSRRLYVNLTNTGTIELVIGDLAVYPPELPIPANTIRLGSWFQSPDNLTLNQIPNLHKQNTDQYLDLGGSYEISAEAIFNKVNESVYDTEQMLIDFISNTDDTATVQVSRDPVTGRLKFNSIGGGGSSTEYIYSSNWITQLSGGKTYGKYLNGQEVQAIGKTVSELLKDISIEYLAPSFSSFLITGQSTEIEVGTSIPSGNITFTWGATNNGNIATNTITLKNITQGIDYIVNTSNDGTEVVNLPSPINFATLRSETFRITGVNTQGTLISRDFTITDFYRIFYGSSSSKPLTSASVRSLPSNRFTNAGNVFTLNTGSVSKIFSLAIPATKSLVSVSDATASNADITLEYILSTFNVNDAAGVPVSYKVYTMEQAVPYSISHAHVITLI